ncbi:MAG TPA: hypothetical protein VM101_00475 [Flavitalea sp.]|nr:hypothetical protein [Flavitalea sp.]
MKMLRKTIKAIVVIGLLKIIWLLLDRYSPASSAFHRQFLFSLQLMVIVWLLMSLLLFILKAGKSWVARFLPVLIVMFVLAIDVLFSFWMESPARIPGFLKKEFKTYYTYYERNAIEFEPCSVFDSIYSYKVIPGLAFNFGNIEYKNNYVVNSESLRDKEDALSGPQIICLGNSYTQGIGVEQNQAFPQLLAKQTGKTVLNTGNSSYGTVRELKRLLNADTSFLEYAVIQYSKYDVYENAELIDNNDSLIMKSDSEYRHAVRDYRWRKEYFPGKYAITITYDFLKSIAATVRKKKYFPSADPVASARYFLKVIDRYKPVGKFKIIVTEMNDYKDMESGFLPAVESLLQNQEFVHLKDMIRTVSVSDVLTPSDYFIIDSDMRPSGHEKVANKIGAFIARDSVVQHHPK